MALKKPRPAPTTLLIDYLRRKGVSQVQLGEACGLSEVRVSRICRGEYPPKPEEKRAIAEALGVTEEEVFHPLLGYYEGRDRARADLDIVMGFFNSEDGFWLWCRIWEKLSVLMDIARDKERAENITDGRMGSGVEGSSALQEILP